jgi:hypothetical protein
MPHQIVTIDPSANGELTVTAHGIIGQVMRRRVYRFGSLRKRWKWARRQAREWAERLYLYTEY